MLWTRCLKKQCWRDRTPINMPLPRSGVGSPGRALSAPICMQSHHSLDLDKNSVYRWRFRGGRDSTSYLLSSLMCDVVQSDTTHINQHLDNPLILSSIRQILFDSVCTAPAQYVNKYMQKVFLLNASFKFFTFSFHLQHMH
jgi:hypothetical protein